MNNIDRIQEYIKDAVISPLERLMNGDSGEPEVNLYEKYYLQGGYPPKDSVYRSMLHAMMVPYYEMYLNATSDSVVPEIGWSLLEGRWRALLRMMISSGTGHQIKT